MLWENHDNQNKDKLFKENQAKMNRSFSNNRGKNLIWQSICSLFSVSKFEMQNICLINFMNYLTNYPLYILNLKILKHPIICLFYFKGVCVCVRRGMCMCTMNMQRSRSYATGVTAFLSHSIDAKNQPKILYVCKQ